MPPLHELIWAKLHKKAIEEQEIHDHDTTAGEHTIGEART